MFTTPLRAVSHKLHLAASGSGAAVPTTPAKKIFAHLAAFIDAADASAEGPMEDHQFLATTLAKTQAALKRAVAQRDEARAEVQELRGRVGRCQTLQSSQAGSTTPPPSSIYSVRTLQEEATAMPTQGAAALEYPQQKVADVAAPSFSVVGFTPASPLRDAMRAREEALPVRLFQEPATPESTLRTTHSEDNPEFWTENSFREAEKIVRVHRGILRHFLELKEHFNTIINYYDHLEPTHRDFFRSKRVLLFIQTLLSQCEFEAWHALSVAGYTERNLEKLSKSIIDEVSEYPTWDTLDAQIDTMQRSLFRSSTH